MSQAAGYDFFRQRPRDGLHLILLCVCMVWQSGIAVGGLVLYLLCVQWLKCRWWMMTGAAAGVLLASAIVDYQYHVNFLSLPDFLRYSFRINFYFWKLNLTESIIDGVRYLYQDAFIYLVAFGLLLAGALSLIDSFFLSPHFKDMQALQKKKRLNPSVIKREYIDKRLAVLEDNHSEGTVMGVSMQNGETVVVNDKNLNQIVLVLGTTGGGKTITMRRFYQRAISQGYPLVIVDGKPSDKNVDWVKNLANKHGRKFYGFNCANHAHYDPLAHGGYTELKDKIITLKDEWSSDYYRSISETYLQTTFEVLIKSGRRFDLQEAAHCLTYDNLCALVRQTHDQDLMERVKSLGQYEKKEITGLQAHLHILLHSELGDYFRLNQTEINLSDIIAQNGVVYFALPALRFPSFSKVLGKLVANDLKAVISHQTATDKKIFTSFDEYSVFAGEQSLNLANMGREKGLHVIFGTQGLADLSKVDKSFMEQITNCANTIICHRLNDHVSAELVAQWVGTKEDYAVTAQINVTEGNSGAGTVRETRKFIIHPDSIKQGLGTGEAFYVTKVDGFKCDKVKVKFS